MLLKPWRNLHLDLKSREQDWRQALTSFINNHPEKNQIEYVISGIQFYHECESAARKATVDTVSIDEQLTEGLDNTDELEDVTLPRITIDTAAENIQEAQVSWPERMHAQSAIDIATICGIFESNDQVWQTQPSRVRRASVDDMKKLSEWKQELRKTSETDNMNHDAASTVLNEHLVQPTVELWSSNSSSFTSSDIFENSNSLSVATPTDLNKDQVSSFASEKISSNVVASDRHMMLSYGTWTPLWMGNSPHRYAWCYMEKEERVNPRLFKQ